MILGITPARGGSKGIPQKNIGMIAGKPLIAWTIEAALKSKLIDRYVVSTEDTRIGTISRKFEAEVIRRPLRLATDRASTLDVLKHTVGLIPCDVVVLLQATPPLRNPGLIDACIKEFFSKGCDSLATGLICKYKEYGNNSLRRQDIPGFFCDDGNVYVIKTDLIRKGDRYGKKMGRKIISRRENIEIDDKFDFWLAEKALMENKLRK